MKFEDRVQLKLSDLTEKLFEKIVAYGFYAPSGMGGPGCVIMISEDGRSYQFYGPELNNLNYYREWASLFPVLNQCDTRQWKLAENVSCTKLFVRNDIYDLFMENLPTPEKMIYYRWEDSCIEEYGVLLVNDSVEGTAFVIDALFHPGLKNASGMNERELKIAREIREGIIKYLSDEEDE